MTVFGDHLSRHVILDQICVVFIRRLGGGGGEGGGRGSTRIEMSQQIYDINFNPVENLSELH